MAASDALPAVSVIVAFYKPDLDLAGRQLDTILAQTGVRVTGVAVFDGAETAGDERLLSLVAAAGFDIVANLTPAGVRGAFAAGLKQALKSAPDGQFFSYADQDDIWHAGKLSRLVDLARSTGAALVHCDARVVSSDGSVIAPSLHRYESRREPEDLFGTLLLNTVTGMTCLFPAETARLAADLMAAYDGPLLHDHITAIAAASIGPLHFLDEALVDYVQHEGNRIGAKLHRPMIRQRQIGAIHLARYRQTSAEMFEERRAVAVLLAEHNRLPQDLLTMFRAARPQGLWRQAWVCMRLSCKPLLAFDFRRWMLALRMADASLLGRLRRPEA